MTLQQLIFHAYSTADEPDGSNNLDQLRDLPKWAESEQFDVTAKVDQQTAARLSALADKARQKIYQKMLQAVFTERCHLNIQLAMREQPVYLLVTSPGGSKLVPSDVPFDHNSLSEGRVQIRAKGYGLGELASNLTESTGRIVVDQTHLTGLYDFQLKWRPDDDTDTSNTSSTTFSAVKEQLGLMLVPSKGPVASLVVTHLDRPTSN